MQHGDTVEYFWDSEGGTVFAHTAIRPDGSVEEQTVPENFTPISTTSTRRMTFGARPARGWTGRPGS